jgi:hypothetical protein
MRCANWILYSSAATLLAVPRYARSDHSSYAAERDIRVETTGITCRHWHDWSSKTEKARATMIASGQDPFGSENNYARVECTAKDGKALFRAPSPALTELWISPDLRYLVGLSKIRISNPYQLVVYRMDGTLVYRLHVAAFEACYDRVDFAGFYREHPDIRSLLQERAIVRGDKIFIDYEFMNAPSRFGRDNWLALDSKRCRSHLSENIVESVSNWVRWYREPDPGIALDRDEHGVATGLTVLDPVGAPIKISFREAPAATSIPAPTTSSSPPCKQ